MRHTAASLPVGQGRVVPYPITVRVTDRGTPQQSDANTFTVTVSWVKGSALP